MENIVDLRPQSVREFKEITAITGHPSLPLLALSEGGEIYFVSTKSMAVLTQFPVPNRVPVKTLGFDAKTFKLFSIDTNGSLSLYRFDLGFEKLFLIKSLDNEKIYHAAFSSDSTSLVCTTAGSLLLIYDFLRAKVRTVEVDDSNFSSSKVEYIREFKRLLFVNKKRGVLMTTDVNEFGQRRFSSFPASEITCYHISGSKILFGSSSGLLRIVEIESFKVLFEQSFEPFDGKTVQVEQITVFNGFVAVGLSSGFVSIINKI